MLFNKSFDVKRYFEHRYGLFHNYKDSLDNKVKEYKEEGIYIQEGFDYVDTQLLGKTKESI